MAKRPLKKRIPKKVKGVHKINRRTTAREFNNARADLVDFLTKRL